MSLNFQWRELWKFEASGLWMAIIVVLPILVGQLAGFPILGLFAGFGGLMLALTEKPGSTVLSLFAATALNSLMVLAGTLVSDHGVLTVALMFLVAFCGGMALVYGEVVGQIGFIATFVFAIVLGQPPTLAVGFERLFEFAAGGAWASVFILLIWRFSRRNPAAPTPRPQLRIGRGELTLRSATFHHALQIAIAAAAAVAVFEFFDLEHGHWLITTALVIVKPQWNDTRQRINERLTGSVVGALAATILLLLIHDLIFIDAILLLFAVLAFSHRATNYRYYVIFLTPFVILTISSAVHNDWHLAFERVLNTFIGGAIAFIVTYSLRHRTIAQTA